MTETTLDAEIRRAVCGSLHVPRCKKIAFRRAHRRNRDIADGLRGLRRWTRLMTALGFDGTWELGPRERGGYSVRYRDPEGGR